MYYILKTFLKSYFEAHHSRQEAGCRKLPTRSNPKHPKEKSQAELNYSLFLAFRWWGSSCKLTRKNKRFELAPTEKFVPQKLNQIFSHQAHSFRYISLFCIMPVRKSKQVKGNSPLSYMFIQKLEVSFKKLLIFVKTLEVRILSDILVVNFTEKRFSPAAPGYYQASALTSSFLLYYFATVI